MRNLIQEKENAAGDRIKVTLEVISKETEKEKEEKEREKNMQVKTEKKVYDSSANSALQSDGQIIQTIKIEKTEKVDALLTTSSSSSSSSTIPSSTSSTPSASTSTTASSSSSSIDGAEVKAEMSSASPPTFNTIPFTPPPPPLVPISTTTLPLSTSLPPPLPLSPPLPMSNSELFERKPPTIVKISDSNLNKLDDDSIKYDENIKLNNVISSKKVDVDVITSSPASSLISGTFFEESASVDQRMFPEGKEVIVSSTLKDPRTLIPESEDEKSVSISTNDKREIVKEKESDKDKGKIIENDNESNIKDIKSTIKGNKEVEKGAIDWEMMKIRGSDIYSRAQGGVEGGRYSQSVPATSVRGSKYGSMRGEGDRTFAGMYSADKRKVVSGLSGAEVKAKAVIGTGDGTNRVVGTGAAIGTGSGVGVVTGTGAGMSAVVDERSPSESYTVSAELSTLSSAPPTLTAATPTQPSQPLPLPLPVPLPSSGSIDAHDKDVSATQLQDFNQKEKEKEVVDLDGESASEVKAIEEVMASEASTSSVAVETSSPSSSSFSISPSSSPSPTESSSSSPVLPLDSTVPPSSNTSSSVPVSVTVSPMAAGASPIRSVRAAYVMAAPQSREANTWGKKSVKRSVTPAVIPSGPLTTPVPVPIPAVSLTAAAAAAATNNRMGDGAAVAAPTVQSALPSSTSPLPITSTDSLTLIDEDDNIEVIEVKMMKDNDVSNARNTLAESGNVPKNVPENVLENNEISDASLPTSVLTTEATPLVSTLSDPAIPFFTSSSPSQSSSSSSSSSTFSPPIPSLTPPHQISSSSSPLLSSSPLSPVPPPPILTTQSVAASLGIADSARKALYQQATEGRARTLTSTVMDIIGPSGPPPSPQPPHTQASYSSSKEFETTNSDTNSNIYSMNNRNKNTKSKINENSIKKDRDKAFIDGYSPATVGGTARRAWQVPVTREGLTTSSLLSAASPSPRLSPTLSQLSNKRLQPRPFSSFPPPPAPPSSVVTQSLKLSTSTSQSSPIVSSYPPQLEEAELVRRTYGLGLGISTDGEISDTDAQEKDTSIIKTEVSEEEYTEMKRIKKEAEAKARSEWVESVMARAKNAEIKARKQEKVSSVRTPTKTFSKEKNSPSWPF